MIIRNLALADSLTVEKEYNINTVHSCLCKQISPTTNLFAQVEFIYSYGNILDLL